MGATSVQLVRKRFWAATLLLASCAAAAEAPAPPPINDTITFFYYEDLEAADDFYGKLLGLEKTMDEDWVRIYRISATSSVGTVLNGRGFHAVSDDKPAMLSLITDNVDAWYDRLTNAGIVIRSELRPADQAAEPGRAPVRGFIAEDPGGYTIEIFTWQN